MGHYFVETLPIDQVMTKRQSDLIEDMNEFCTEKFDMSYQRTKEEARDYISRNMREFKLLTADNWSLSNGYF